MRKRPPRAPPNGGDCTISKRGLSNTKVKKILSPGRELGTVPVFHAKGEGWHRTCLARLARFLSGRFYAKRLGKGAGCTFLQLKFTFRELGTV